LYRGAEISHVETHGGRFYASEIAGNETLKVTHFSTDSFRRISHTP